MGTLQRLSRRQVLPLLALTGAALTGCEVAAPTSAPTTAPLSSNQVYVTPGGVCSLSGITIDKTGDVEGAQNLVDGQCMQPWTSLSYQAPTTNSTAAQCRVSYQTGFSYHYAYQQPQTNITYYTGSQRYDVPQTAISYYSSSQSYSVPETTISYYTSSQSYDFNQTKISYYTSRQEFDSPFTSVSYYVQTQSYDTPTTNVTFYTQENQSSLNLAGDFSAQGCAAFVAGKLPAGALSDPYHLPVCSAGPLRHSVGTCSVADGSKLNCASAYAQTSLPSPLAGNYQVSGCSSFTSGKLSAAALLGDTAHPVTCAAAAPSHKIGACDPSDTSILNCGTVYAQSSLSPTAGSYLLSGTCSAYAADKLPGNAITADSLHPVSCSAAPSVHHSGACDPSDTSITNCATAYAQGTITNQQGDFTAGGCAVFANGKIPAGAITGDASHPVVCAAGVAQNKTGACSPSDTSITNCTTNYASHSLTVNGSLGAQDCATFSSGKLPGSAIFGDASHAIACSATSQHKTGACDPSDASITNCATAYAQQSLNNVNGDFAAAGCATFVTGKLPAGAILADSSHPIACASGTTASKTADGSLAFSDLTAALPSYSPALNGACSADLAGYLATAKGLPAATSCSVTALQSDTYTYNGATCAAANPAGLCTASNGAKKNCTGTDVAAAPAYSNSFTVSKVKGNVTCDTLCSATAFCSTLSGTVGENYHNCSVAAAASTADHGFTAASSTDTHVCSSGSAEVVSNGPYGVHTPPLLSSNLPNNACIQTTVCLNDTAWKKLTPVKAIPSIDLVILFDVTSSMTPQIQAMVLNLQNLVRNLNTLTPSLRLGLASYRDFADAGGQAGDLPFMLNVPLTSDIAAVSNGLSSLTASGGGDLPESLSTALRATVTGNAMAPYFGASTMGWENDPSRIKVVLAISDAADKKSGLPTGAATLDEVAALLKSQGILFMGIGYQDQTEPYAGENAFRSLGDFSYLAQNTGAIITAPGIDLDGDGLTTTYGELAPGAPAVLLMTEDGHLQGAPMNADPTRVLADAITQMVVTTRPFQFNLNVTSGGRTYTPPSNSLSIPSEANGQSCFTQVSMQPLDAMAACGLSTPIALAINEASTNSNVSNSDFVASVNVNGNCYIPPTPTNPTPPTNTPWAVIGFDGVTTGTTASLIWQVTGSGTLTTATLNVGTRPDQLNTQSITANATLGSQLLTVSGLSPATTYYFQVTVRDNAGTVISSGVISKTTKVQ